MDRDPPTSLDDKHARVRIFGEAVRQRATRRTGTNNDVVIDLHAVNRGPLLIAKSAITSIPLRVFGVT